MFGGCFKGIACRRWRLYDCNRRVASVVVRPGGVSMNVIMRLFVVGATVMSLQPDQFFGKPETLPVSGPVIGKQLPDRFGAEHVSGKYLNPSSTLE